MAPSNGTTSTPPKLVVTLPPNHSTLQWHPAMAPRPPQSWSSPSPTIAHYNGTLRWPPSNGTLVPRPIPQSGSSPSPPIGSKNPYSYRYLGKKDALSLYIRVEARWKVFFSHHNAGANCISMIPKAEVHGFWWFPLWFWRPICWRNFSSRKVQLLGFVGCAVCNFVLAVQYDLLKVHPGWRGEGGMEKSGI